MPGKKKILSHYEEWKYGSMSGGFYGEMQFNRKEH